MADNQEHKLQQTDRPSGGDEPDPKAVSLRANRRVVTENNGASLLDIGDGVLCLEFHTEMNGLDADIRAMLVEAADEVERGNWQGLVIGNQGADFCVGTNLAGGLDDPESASKEMQDALMSLRYCSKPVVVAPFSRTLGVGVEVAMAGSRIVAASETQMGLVQMEVGLIPSAGGCKEMVRRLVSPVLRRTPNADPLPFVQNALQTISTAKVSSTAEEAQAIGFLTPSDRIVPNRDHLLYEAKHEALEMAAAGYTAPVRDRNCYAAGRDVRAGLVAGIHQLKQGGYVSEYDAYISGRLAYVLTGGNLSSGQWVDEQYLLDLERQVLVELAKQPKTHERIQSMLANGKPLRN